MKRLTLKELGESKIIEIIEQLIFEKTGEKIQNDDAFFMNLKIKGNLNQNYVVINTDMLVSTSDVPQQMTPFHIGRKSIIMNISDLLVKGITPVAVIISLGLPNDMLLTDFKELMKGIIETCKKFNLKYLGGDLNETKEEIIINPTVFGFGQKNKIIYRKGMKVEDLLCINGCFGLTGVGFNIILNKFGDFSNLKYKKAIDSVINPSVSKIEGKILAENKLATSSIDSSDGLAKSLKELTKANNNLGFEINLNDVPTEKFVKEYSEKFNIPFEKLIFNGGEEFIHLFTIKPSDFKKAAKLIKEKNGYLIPIGKVIAENKIYIIKDDKRNVLKDFGYEHFITVHDK
ncbi:MAG: thiamine-phosphate kinase [Candidatus Lokiarchaeota archaeon]|nr:thiamine-phosphate kinase [Candidatus Lokiarchaeota archaeon]